MLIIMSYICNTLERKDSSAVRYDVAVYRLSLKCVVSREDFMSGELTNRKTLSKLMMV